jgi:MerR HTH family regulatory protein
VVDHKIESTVNFTPGQVRQAVGLPQETLRHWRGTFSFLRDIRGHGPVYRPGQILALAIIKRLVQDCGLTVNSLKPVDGDLYGAVNGTHWSALESSCLAIDLKGGSVAVVEGRSVDVHDSALLVLPFAPVITHLRRELTGMELLEPQQSFAFPPHAVGSLAEKASA